MLYWRYEKYIKSLCSFGEPLPPQAAKLPRAKMEAGENPARSRHCKEGAFSDHVGMSCKVQDIFIKPLRTRQISRKRSYPLGRQENVLSQETCIDETQVHSIGGMQWILFVVKLSQNSKNGLLSGRI